MPNKNHEQVLDHLRKKTSTYAYNSNTHLNIYSMYFVSMKGSLMETTLTMGFFREARRTSRPMRPKPLIPTVTGPTDWEHWVSWKPSPGGWENAQVRRTGEGGCLHLTAHELDGRCCDTSFHIFSLFRVRMSEVIRVGCYWTHFPKILRITYRGIDYRWWDLQSTGVCPK